MEESREDTLSEDRSAYGATAMPEKRRVWVVFAAMSLLVLAVGAALVAALGAEQAAMWQVQSGDIYQVAHQQRTYNVDTPGNRLLMSDMEDPTVLVSTIFVLEATREHVDLVVFMGEIDTKRSGGLFSVLFSDDDDFERGKSRVPLVLVRAEAVSGRVKKVMAPVGADDTMIQIANAIATDLLLNRDSRVYLGSGYHKSTGLEECPYPETHAGSTFCPVFTVEGTENSTVYVKEYTSGGGRQLGEDLGSSFQAKKSTYVNKRTGHPEKTCTSGSLTVQLIGNTDYTQQLLSIEQEASTRFTLKAKALSKSDVELFRYLIDNKLRLVDVTHRFDADRELATSSLRSVPIFNILGFKINLETDLRATPEALRVTVTLVVQNFARIVLASGLIGGDVLEAVKKVQRLSDQTTVTLDQTLSLLAHYSTSGVDTWRAALWTANECIWDELHKLQSSDFELGVTAALAWRKEKILEVVANYTTTVRQEVTVTTKQVQELNSTFVANATLVKSLNETLTTYLVTVDEIWMRINEQLALQKTTRLQIQSFIVLINKLQDEVYAKDGLNHFLYSLREVQSNVTYWAALSGIFSTALGTMLAEINADLSHFDSLLRTEIPNLQAALDTAAAPLQEKVDNLENQLYMLVSQNQSLGDALDSIAGALADVEDQIKTTTDSAQLAELNQQKQNLMTDIQAVTRDMQSLGVNIDLATVDLRNSQAQLDAVLDGYEQVGYREGDDLKQALTAHLQVMQSLLAQAAMLDSAMKVELAVLTANSTTTAYTATAERDWLQSLVGSLATAVNTFAELASSLTGAKTLMTLELTRVSAVLEEQKHFSSSNTLFMDLDAWRSGLYSHQYILQTVAVSTLPALQSTFLSINNTATAKVAASQQALAALVPVDSATKLRQISEYQLQRDVAYQLAEVTIPAKLEELYKRLNATIDIVKITNTTLIEAVNNKTVPSPLVSTLQTHVTNLTYVLETIENHTFSWRSVFVQEGILNLSQVFQVSEGRGDCNLTEIQRCMDVSLSTIQDSVLGESALLRERVNAVAQAFGDIDQLPTIRLTLTTATFLNMTQITTKLSTLLSYFTSTDAQLWAVESQLRQNTTSMQTYIAQQNVSSLSSDQLAQAMAAVREMESLYLVTFEVPKVVEQSVSAAVLNETSALVGMFTVAPLIALYESEFNASLTLTQTVLVNRTRLVDTYLSSYSSPLITYAHNVTAASFVLGPLCIPFACLYLAANMSLAVDLMTGVGFDGNGFYAIMKPKTLGQFTGIGVVSLGTTKLQVGLRVVSPIEPTYRIGAVRGASRYFVDGVVAASYSAKVNLIVTDYDKIVDGSCWCVRDGKAYRKLCLNWQRLFFYQPKLMWSTSAAQTKMVTLVANLTLDAA